MVVDRWWLLVGWGVALAGCTPERVPPPCCTSVEGCANEVSLIEVGSTVRYKVRFVGTGPRTEVETLMRIRASEFEGSEGVEAFTPDAIQAFSAVDCSPFSDDADLGWVYNPQSALNEIARFELEAIEVPFDVQCELELSVARPGGPERTEGQPPITTQLVWGASLELTPPSFDGEERHRARVDIDRLD